MTTAFQQSAFQNNAFQISAITPDTHDGVDTYVKKHKINLPEYEFKPKSKKIIQAVETEISEIENKPKAIKEDKWDNSKIEKQAAVVAKSLEEAQNKILEFQAIERELDEEEEELFMLATLAAIN